MRALVLAVWLMLSGPCGRAALAADAAPEPFELVRALQVSQDAIAQGDADAHLSQRERLAKIGEALAHADEHAWKDARNLRAAITFALSGGNIGLLQSILPRLAVDGIDQRLVQGAVAYAQGRNAAAAELLGQVDVRALAPGLAGHVALVRSELIAKTDPAKAVALLEEARLLSPGTLIEEVALRREAISAATQGDLRRFESLWVRYLSRFPRSVYATAFRELLASSIADHGYTNEQDRSRLAAALAQLRPDEQRELDLGIARQGVIKGKVELARFGAREAARLSTAGSTEAARAQVYAAAALVASSEFEQASAALAGIGKDGLGAEEVELARAADAVAAEVRQLPARPADAVPQKEAEQAATDFTVLGRARAAVAGVDRLLAEAR